MKKISQPITVKELVEALQKHPDQEQIINLVAPSGSIWKIARNKDEGIDIFTSKAQNFEGQLLLRIGA